MDKKDMLTMDKKDMLTIASAVFSSCWRIP